MHISMVKLWTFCNFLKYISIINQQYKCDVATLLIPEDVIKVYLESEVENGHRDKRKQWHIWV